MEHQGNAVPSDKEGVWGDLYEGNTYPVLGEKGRAGLLPWLLKLKIMLLSQWHILGMAYSDLVETYVLKYNFYGINPHPLHRRPPTAVLRVYVHFIFIDVVRLLPWRAVIIHLSPSKCESVSTPVFHILAGFGVCWLVRVNLMDGKWHLLVISICILFPTREDLTSFSHVY